MLKKILLILLSICIVLSLCYLNATKINTKQLKVREEKLTIDSLSQDNGDLLIAYFSDLYYGNYIDNDYLDKLINKLNDFNPDVIIFGGDLIDSQAQISDENKQYLIDSLKSLEATYGKYAILGDQDLTDYEVKNNIQDILTSSNFNIITNENVIIANGINSCINLVGIDCYVNGSPDFTKSFEGINTSNYTMVVSHCPDTFADILNYDFDYMLAGHSLAGQIYIPIISYFKKQTGAKKYYRGKQTSDNKTLDITNGVGRTGSNARFMADSEIVLYRLSPAKTDTEA